VKAAPPMLDIDRWATRTRGLSGGQRCASCVAVNANPAARQAQDRIVHLVRSGKSSVTPRQIAEFLRDTFGLQLPKPNAYRDHLRDHCQFYDPITKKRAPAKR
jgi:hypothetical protein